MVQEVEDVGSMFQAMRDSYATEMTIVPSQRNESENSLLVDSKLYENQMVKMMRVREITSKGKHAKRSDVHQLACALDDTLRSHLTGTDIV